MVDASKVDHPGPEPGVTTGVKPFSFEEEGITGTEVTGVTGARVTVQDAQAWVEGHLSETPLPVEVEQVGKHCWPAWSKHWDLDLAGAIVVWTKTPASRRKFRKDAVMHLVKVGLPKPPVIDPEQERARGRAAAWLDQRLEEAPKRDAECAGCGKRRQLPPGENHCHSCRTTVEVAA